MYNHIKPVNIRGASGGHYHMPFNIERQFIVNSIGEDGFRRELRARIVSLLQSGFAVPNSDLAWTTLFSNLQHEQYQRLAEISRRLGERHPLASLDGEAHKPLLVHLAVVLAENYYEPPAWRGSWDPADLAYGASLPLVNVGTGDSRCYTSLCWACDKILEMQGFERSADEKRTRAWPQLAKPRLLRTHMHEFIDRLVQINNGVQNFCRYIRNAVEPEEVEEAHRLDYTDDELQQIAESSPAVMFTSALAGTHQTAPAALLGVRGRAAACPV